MRVEVYTDASIFRGRGAWATVVLCDAGQFETSGTLKGAFQSSTATELCAIANALHWARVEDMISKGDEVEVWSDNVTAVNRVNASYVNKHSTDPRLIEGTRWIRDFRKRHELKVSASHIKGHQRLDTPDPRAIYNQRCDELCGCARKNVEAPTFEVLQMRVERARALAARLAERDAA